MSFSQSGSVITQTGTDTDLTGVASYVTVTDLGVLKVYNFGDNSLVINGDLTVNGSETGVRECLVIGTGSQDVIDIEVTSTGKLTVGRISDSGEGEYIGSQHTASIMEKDIGLDFGSSRGKSDAWGGSTRPFLLVRGGGSFVWNGTMIFCGGMAFDGSSNGGNTNSIIRLNNAVWDARNVGENSAFDQIIYSYTEDIEVNGLTVIAPDDLTKGIIFTQLATPLKPLIGYTGVFTDSAFSGSTTTPVGFELTIQDYNGIIGNSGSVDIQPQGRTDTTTGEVTFLNSSVGNSLKISTSESDTLKLIQVVQSLEGTFKDSAGNNIGDFIVATLDKINTLYYAMGDAGVFSFNDKLLLCKFEGGVGVSPMVKTTYSPTDDDLWDIYLYSYLYYPLYLKKVQMRSLGGKLLEFIGTLDIKISESDRSVVDAYGVLDSGEKIYDRAKSWKLQSENVSYPSIDKSLVVANGDELDFGDLKVIFDKGYANLVYSNPENNYTLDNTINSEGNIVAPSESVRSANFIFAVDVDFPSSGVQGCVLELGGEISGGSGTPFTLGTYALSTKTEAEADFNFTDPTGTGLQDSGNARKWNWNDTDTPSSNVGPTSGQGGSPDGYVHPEASSPTENGDLFYMELDHTFSCKNLDVTVSFYTNQRGDDNTATCKLQYQEDGGSWVDIATYGGESDPNKVASSGTQIWAYREETVPSNSDSVRVRWVVETTSDTVWHCDYGLDTIKVEGVASNTTEKEALYLGFDSSGKLVFRAGSGDTLDNCARLEYSALDFSSKSGTIYGIVDMSNSSVKAYWLEGGNSSGNEAVFLGESTANTPFSQWASSEDGALGSVNGDTAVGEEVSDFSGTISQARFFYEQDFVDPFQTNTGTPCFDVDKGNNQVIIDCGNGISSSGFKQILTTDIVEFRNDVNITGYSINSDLHLISALDLEDLNVEGDLHINISGDNVLDFSNVSVSGEVFNDNTAGTLTINANSCSLVADNAGTGDGQVNILNTVLVKVTVIDAVSKLPIQGARVYIKDDSETILNDLTDSNGVCSIAYNYSADKSVQGVVRKASSTPYYKSLGFSGVITVQGFNITVQMILDE